MTKNFFIKSFLICLLGVSSCSAKYTGGKFEVTGKVSDPKSKMIYLKEVDFANNITNSIDSSKIQADGSYTLKSNGAGQHLFIIMVDQGFPFLVINDKSKIGIDINPSSPLHPIISGSDATKNLYTFVNKYRLKDSTLTKTFTQLDSLTKIHPSTPQRDSVITNLGEQKDAQITAMNDLVKSFVTTSDNAVSVFYVLAIMAPRSFIPQDLLPLAQAASNRFKDDGNLAGFVSKVQEAVGQDSGMDFPLLSKSAPDMTMPDPDGKMIKISDFKGKFLLVDFWASWCMPCRAENPNVVAMYNKYKNKNFTILGVSLDNDKNAWIRAIQSDHLSWNQMSDLKKWSSLAVKTYGVTQIPFNVLIDPSGKIIADDLRGDDLDQKLAQVLN